MKKYIARTIVWIAISTFIIGLVYCAYIEPISNATGLDKWYEYLLAVIGLTVLYALLLGIVIGILKIVDWALANSN